MTQKTILVSGASGIVGYGILKSLKMSKKRYKLIGTSIYDFSVAPAFCDFFEKAVPTENEGYKDWLFNIIKKYSVDMIIPGIEADMFFWNKIRTNLLEIGTFPLLNNSELIDLCFDKWIFYKKLVSENQNIAIPTSIDNNYNAFHPPLLLKPRRGFGSKGIVRINSKKDFDLHKDKIGNELMLQPIIGSEDEEFTVSAFFNNESVLINFLSLKRKLSKEGFTQEAQVVDIDIKKTLTILGNIFKPIGPTNFQFRFDGTDFKLLEINPRISSATSIRAALGYNESLMSINYFLDKQIIQEFDVKHILNKRAIRYTEDYII